MTARKVNSEPWSQPMKGLLIAVMHYSGSFGEWPLTTHDGHSRRLVSAPVANDSVGAGGDRRFDLAPSAFAP
jgi:hypothetical protein